MVLPILINREFVLQKVDIRSSRPYSSYGDGASKTRSSAYASMKSCKEAIVYAVLLAWHVPLAAKYDSRYGYILSKNRMNSSGEAPSPCFTPILAMY